jgi:hypothetical protein
MQGLHIPICLNFLDAALAANATYRVKFPFPSQLVYVNGACANTTSFILDVGTAADDDAYLDGVTVTGAAATTTGFGRANFVNGEYPKIAADTEIVVTIDYDGGAGGDASDVSVTLLFTEG